MRRRRSARRGGASGRSWSWSCTRPTGLVPCSAFLLLQQVGLRANRCERSRCTWGPELHGPDRAGLLDAAGPACARLRVGRRAAVVTQPAVASHAARVADSLRGAGFEPTVLLVPEGEGARASARPSGSGTPSSLTASIGPPRRRRRRRRGGRPGGVAGAAFMRGLPVIQVPTTLLAQVDASVGGKVAVNHPRGKNLIGAFHQPRLVLIDPEALRTLPEREYRSGLAEVVKTGAALNADLFAALESGLDQLRRRDATLLGDVVATCCTEKARIVERDEREETGLRMVLNYGHTVGHALEALRLSPLAPRRGRGHRADCGRADRGANRMDGRAARRSDRRRCSEGSDSRPGSAASIRALTRCIAPRQEGPGWPRALRPPEERGAGGGLPRRPDGHGAGGLAGDPGMTRARTRTAEREPMRRMPWGPMLCVLVLGAALAGCDGPNRGFNTQPSAASGLILDLVATPTPCAGPGRDPLPPRGRRVLAGPGQGVEHPGTAGRRRPGALRDDALLLHGRPDPAAYCLRQPTTRFAEPPP